MPAKNTDNNKPNNQIKVYISNTDEVLFNDNALDFSSLNDLGEFSIIPMHTNFRSIIYKKMTITKTDGSKETFNFNKGVLSFADNSLEVYIV